MRLRSQGGYKPANNWTVLERIDGEANACWSLIACPPWMVRVLTDSRDGGNNQKGMRSSASEVICFMLDIVGLAEELPLNRGFTQ